MANDVPSTQAKPEAQAVIELMRDLHDASAIAIGEVDGEAVSILTRPRGMETVSLKPFLDEYRTAPERRAGIAVLRTLQSLIDHANRFKDGASALFLNDVASPRLVCVLDYHGAYADKDIGPRFGKHRGHYDFPLSEEWEAWRAVAEGEPMAQREFAEFLEEHIQDVLDPGAATPSVQDFVATLGMQLAGPQRLFELSRGLALKVDQKVASAVNLSTGEGQILFNEAHTDQAGAPLKIPTAFAIGIPVFRGGAPYALPVRMRYRVSGGQVAWTLAPHRMDAAFRDAMEIAATDAQKQTGLPLFWGSPE